LEKIAFRNADLLLTVSEKEKELLISLGFPTQKIIVVPNGVNTEFFSRPSDLQEIRRRYGLDGSRIVVFVGNLAYMPNREAVKLISSIIAPKVREKVKAVKFLVIGKKRDEMNLPGITFTGFVDNIADLLAASDVGIAPLLQGSGTRLKILEYFSSGIPVVSTSVGAEGLVTENRQNIFIDDNLENFAEHIIQLLKDKALSSTMGEAGRAVAATYDWKKITRELEEDYLYFISKYP
jgi:glycosyltransferase involved in cell wall biosynthesis